MNEQIEFIPQDSQVIGLTIKEFLQRAVYTPLVYTDNEETNKQLEEEARAAGEKLDRATIRKYGLKAEDLILSYGKLYAKLSGKITDTAGAILQGIQPAEAVSLEELRERQAYYDDPASDPRLASFMSAEQKQAEIILKSSKVKKPRAGKGKLKATSVQAEYTHKAKEIREQIQPTSEENVLEIIRQVMDIITKEYYLDITNDLKEFKPNINNMSFEYCYKFLTYRVANELRLLQTVKGNTQKAMEIIWNKANSFLPQPEIEKISSTRPTELILAMDKFSNKLPELEQNEFQNIAMAHKKKGNDSVDIVVTVALDNPSDEIKIIGSRKITARDRDIEDAIISYVVSGDNMYFTPEIINTVISGDFEARLTPNKRDEIENSIEKMQYTPANIDSSNLALELGIKAVVYKGYYLPVEKIEFVYLNGTKTSVYHLLAMPPRYRLADSLNQIERLPLSINNTPLEKSIGNVTLQNYLLRRVLQIKRSDSLNNTILFENIYRELGALEPREGENANNFKQRRKSIRDRVIKVLEFYKTGQKRPDPKSKHKDTEPIIRSYQINDKGKEKYYSVSINPIRENNSNC